ncbi:EamA family transporter [Botrimarina sp.]|uniref:DMT family transporter n=1 Tax=Botrimarina sp. TaxID=2795802 RepID=UPI0032EF7E41
MAYVYFVAVCLFFGSNFILMDRATRWFGPIEVGFGRVASAAALLAVLWVTLDRRQRLRRRDWGVAAAVGLIANAYPYALQPTLISSGMGHSFFGMTVAFTPLMTILVSMPMLGVRPTTRQLVGVVLGFAFVILLMYDGKLRGIGPGLLALAASVPLSYSVGNTWIRRSLNHVDPTPLAVMMLLVSSTTLAPIVASPTLQGGLGVEPPAPREGFAVAVMALAWLGALGTAFSMWAFIHMVQQRGPLFAGMVTYVVPVVALGWGVFDDETITPWQILAVVGILSMVTLVQSPSKTETPSPIAIQPAAGAEDDPDETAEESWSPDPEALPADA